MQLHRKLGQIHGTILPLLIKFVFFETPPSNAVGESVDLGGFIWMPSVTIPFLDT